MQLIGGTVKNRRDNKVLLKEFERLYIWCVADEFTMFSDLILILGGGICREQYLLFL